MRVVISQGQGKLHLNETCCYLKAKGVNVIYLTGWLPRRKSPMLINIIGKMLGRNNLYKSLMQRHPKGLRSNEVMVCSIPEFYMWFLIILSKLKMMSLDNVLSLGWLYWGRYTRRYIKDAEIFHVRSGAGQGGAIQKARLQGMVVVADHSIAHPNTIKKYLLKEYEKCNLHFDLDPTSKFWSLVVKDCEDSDYIIVNSDFVKDTFIENGFNEEKISVVYLGVRDDFFFLKDCWKINDTVIKLLFTGTFGLRKGARVIIEALHILNKKKVPIVLNVVGLCEDLDCIARTYTLPENIKFHGSVLQDDLKNFLKESDIYIFPTFAEGCARSVMEAMAAGLPVITTYPSGAPIKDGVNGIIIPVGDAQSLADAIIKLGDDYNLRKVIGQNAAGLIKNEFTWSKYAEKLKMVYLTCIDKKKI